MLEKMSSEEITGWKAYFALKEELRIDEKDRDEFYKRGK